MQKLLIIPALLVGAFFVSGCGDDGEFGDDDMSADNPRYVLVDTPEGPESCILAPGTGISCDWSTP